MIKEFKMEGGLCVKSISTWSNDVSINLAHYDDQSHYMPIGFILCYLKRIVPVLSTDNIEEK